ncbi:metallophosphoesterase [Colletes latitarsis]|uniref:metallophosphoesterase n=1 Tax=Colletes latitarsis TaxID=2605962 RepID=UPI004035F710
MLRRNRLKNRAIAIGFLVMVTAIYNELLVYDVQKFKWSVRECSECVKVLLVADPQVLGKTSENYFGALIAQWDSDRYLKKTFSRALDHSQPHVVAFLGDLMDEGHIANEESFTEYKKRLDSIFEMPDHIMKIYLPGDNDIGGEEDAVSFNIHNRFKFAYSQPDTLVYKSVTFFKVNRLTHSMPEAPKDAFLNDYAERNTTNVVFSHMPLLFMPGTFVQNVLKELSPQIIFTGHEHKAMHISLDTATDQLSEIWILPPYETPLYQLRMDVGDIHEVQMPTCSYRMGTLHTGYGLAYIDTQEKTVEFTILWLPGRFPQLWIYVFVGVFILAFSIFVCISSYCLKSHAVYSRMSSI